MREKFRGFTLIELLIVVATIGLLLAVLVPVVNKGLYLAKRAKTQIKMQQITEAWMAYATDHNGFLVCAETSTGTLNGQACWVQGGNTKAALQNGALWPYLGSLDVFNDEESVLPYYNSFAMNGCLNGVADRFTARRPATIGRMSEIAHTSSTMVLVPDFDNRGSLLGSFVIDPPNWSWVDRVSGTYEGGDNLSFADGHVEYHRWEDPDTLGGTGYNHYHRDPGSVDMSYMARIYFPR